MSAGDARRAGLRRADLKEDRRRRPDKAERATPGRRKKKGKNKTQKNAPPEKTPHDLEIKRKETHLDKYTHP